MNTSTISNDTLNLTSALEIIQKLVAENKQLKTENQELKTTNTKLSEALTTTLKEKSVVKNKLTEATTTLKVTEQKREIFQQNKEIRNKILSQQKRMKAWVMKKENEYLEMGQDFIISDNMYDLMMCEPNNLLQSRFSSRTEMLKQQQELKELLIDVNQYSC